MKHLINNKTKDYLVENSSWIGTVITTFLSIVAFVQSSIWLLVGVVVLLAITNVYAWRRYREAKRVIDKLYHVDDEGQRHICLDEFKLHPEINPHLSYMAIGYEVNLVRSDAITQLTYEGICNDRDGAGEMYFEVYSSGGTSSIQAETVEFVDLIHDPEGALPYNMHGVDSARRGFVKYCGKFHRRIRFNGDFKCSMRSRINGAMLYPVDWYHAHIPRCKLGSVRYSFSLESESIFDVLVFDMSKGGEGVYLERLKPEEKGDRKRVVHRVDGLQGPRSYSYRVTRSPNS